MNYNKSGLGILLFSVVFSFIYFFYVIFFSPSIKLAELTEDGPAEGVGAPAVAMVSSQQPWLASPAGVAKGKKVYQTYCFTCHGAKGLGDGPAGGALKPPPRNLVEGDWQKGGSSIELFETLVKGIEGTSMVSFSYLSKEDRWAVVHYVRSLTQNKVEDDPKKLEEFGKQAQ